MAASGYRSNLEGRECGRGVPRPYENRLWDAVFRVSSQWLEASSQKLLLNPSAINQRSQNGGGSIPSDRR